MTTLATLEVELLQKKLAARYVGVHVRTLERLAKAGLWPPRKRVGGRWFYPRRELMTWISAADLPTETRQSATESDNVRQLDEVA